MTEKNADVEWLRAKYGSCRNPVAECTEHNRLTCGRARRLLAHIDLLEAEISGYRRSCQDLTHMINESRPTVHEIAAQMMAALIAFNPKEEGEKWESITTEAYRGAEALVAEGRRRDGL